MKVHSRILWFCLFSEKNCLFLVFLWPAEVLDLTSVVHVFHRYPRDYTPAPVQLRQGALQLFEETWAGKFGGLYNEGPTEQKGQFAQEFRSNCGIEGHSHLSKLAGLLRLPLFSMKVCTHEEQFRAPNFGSACVCSVRPAFPPLVIEAPVVSSLANTGVQVGYVWIYIPRISLKCR